MGESLPALRLRALLQSEDHPLHRCGRAYTSRLEKGRDRPPSLEKNVAAADSGSCAGLAATPPDESNDDGGDALRAGRDGEQGDARHHADSTPPDIDPRIALLLLKWRRTASGRLVEWFPNFESVITKTAMSYLDTYSLSACVPDEFARIMGDCYLAHPSSLPAPPKNRTEGGASEEHEDYLWEYMAKQQHKFWEATFEEKYMLAALASLYLACKIHQSDPFPPWQFSNACRGRFSPREIEEMEWEILLVLGVRVPFPSQRARSNQEAMSASLSCDGGNSSSPPDESSWTLEDDTQMNSYEHVDYEQYLDSAEHTFHTSALGMNANASTQYNTPAGWPNNQDDEIRMNEKWPDERYSNLQNGAMSSVHGAFGGIATPSPLDVLSGRGGQTNHHSGNARFRAEARLLRSEYRDGGTSSGKKSLLHQELVKKVQQYGGRFLKRGHDGLWYQVPDKEARRKASQALREKRWD